MAELKINPGDWVVVCDGAKALVMENAGNRKTPNLITKEIYQQPDPKTRELGTDRPGRSFRSVGTARSAMEQTDWHEQEEERFLARLAARLDKAVLAGETKGVIVAAPPRALGILRRELSQHVLQVLRAEIDKDLIKLPAHEIARHLVN